MDEVSAYYIKLPIVGNERETVLVPTYDPKRISRNIGYRDGVDERVGG
jgi:hypothetical protein